MLNTTRIRAGTPAADPGAIRQPDVTLPEDACDPATLLDLFETQDKGRNTAAVAAKMGVPAERIIVMSDSGWDGPHFERAYQAGAFTISSMTKPSLAVYCDK